MWSYYLIFFDFGFLFSLAGCYFRQQGALLFFVVVVGFDLFRLFSPFYMGSILSLGAFGVFVSAFEVMSCVGVVYPFTFPFSFFFFCMVGGGLNIFWCFIYV